ncbi:GUN4 domain-containing protein [Cylindrospermopsis raciborskii]|uniref:GUN4 domain-containing protein n=1 Tax=Cylindrospermopsis raciborskii TaxID=77022 RepID=UPI003DA3BCBB
MNDLPRQKLKEIIIQYGRDLCDNPKRCEAFLNDYCGQYRREIFLLISALKQGVAKDLLNSGNIPVEVLLGRLINQMQNDLGLTKEAAQYAVESWAQVLDKMPQITTLQKTRRAEQKQETTSSVPTPGKYTKLETLLKAQKFKEADEETRSVMLAVANRQSEGYLRVEDAENFPCEELRTIDNLWLKYSQGKFGISVQQEIYKNLGGTKKFNYEVWKSFGDRVGWFKQGSWLYYSDLNFSLSAPTGQLPLHGVVGGLVGVGLWALPSCQDM